jgi:hypothetical protein
MIFQLLGQVPAGILWAELTQDLKGGKLRPEKMKHNLIFLICYKYFTRVCLPGNSTAQNDYPDEKD